MGMDVYGLHFTAPEGEYFCATVWSWRPIHALCETVLKKELPEWGYAGGKGFRTQEECDDLANNLEAYLANFPNDQVIELESDTRVDDEDYFLPRGSTEGRSAYYTSVEHVREFIKFLRACGGFEIY